MVNAMKVVQSGEMGVNETTLEYGAPKMTSLGRTSGRVVHGTNPGSELCLIMEEESELATFLIEVCKMGHGKKQAGSNLDCSENCGEERTVICWSGDVSYCISIMHPIPLKD